MNNKYIVTIIFEENHNLFGQPIVDKPNLIQKLAYWISKFVFRNLILNGSIRIYLKILLAFAFVMFILALISSLFGIPNAILISYTYMFLMLLVIPFLAFFFDVYQAMQLRLGMNLAIREKSYSKQKKKEKTWSTGKFEWTPTIFAILNAIISRKRSYSYGELGKIAGVDRQTAASAIKKLVNSGLIYKDEDNYRFSGVDFEVWIRNNKETKPRTLSKEEHERLRYLFEIMCFVTL